MSKTLWRRFGVATAVFSAFTLVLCAVGAPASAATSCTTMPALDIQQRILTDINAARANAGAAPLARNSIMDDVAMAWSQRQADARTMSHNPSYSSEIPSGWSAAAENVAYGYAPSTVVNAWLNSPGHRANILQASHNYTGIGVACSASGQLYYTQVFGTYRYQAPAENRRFVDVWPTTTFSSEIGWLADRGISTGWIDGTYRPALPVSRDVMAAFLYRLAGSPYAPPPAQSPFIDVPVNYPFYKEISWLAASGISTGWIEPGGATFRPGQSITRGEMSAFLYRFEGSPEYSPSASSPFVDVSGDTTFSREIRWLAAQGISTGWAESNGCRSYRPYDSVLRDVMAAFLYRTTVAPATALTEGQCSPTR